MLSQFRRSRRKDTSSLQPSPQTKIQQDKQNNNLANFRKVQTQSIVNIRRQTARQIKDINLQSQQKIKALTQKHKKQMEQLTVSYQKQMKQKDEYIKMLQQMIEGDTGLLVSQVIQQGQPQQIPKTAKFSHDRACSMANIHIQQVIQQTDQKPRDPQLTNRLYLDNYMKQSQQPSNANDHLKAKSLAKKKSRSLFVAQKVSKHKINPMMKPSYTKHS